MFNKHVWEEGVLHAYRHYITAMYLPQSDSCQSDSLARHRTVLSALRLWLGK